MLPLDESLNLRSELRASNPGMPTFEASSKIDSRPSMQAGLMHVDQLNTGAERSKSLCIGSTSSPVKLRDSLMLRMMWEAGMVIAFGVATFAFTWVLAMAQEGFH